MVGGATDVFNRENVGMKRKYIYCDLGAAAIACIGVSREWRIVEECQCVYTTFMQPPAIPSDQCFGFFGLPHDAHERDRVDANNTEGGGGCLRANLHMKWDYSVRYGGKGDASLPTVRRHLNAVFDPTLCSTRIWKLEEA